jgi:glutamine synthetase
MKGRSVKPKAVLAYCREKGIRSFDLRYTDLLGGWRQVTLPIANLSEGSFEEGLGQEAVLDPFASYHPYSILVPQSQAHYLDPFTQQPALVLVAAIQDILQREDSPFDSRFVAAQSLRYLQSTAIADEVRVRISVQFSPASSQDAEGITPDRNTDSQFLIRSRVADHSAEAGVSVDRHFLNSKRISEFALQPKSILEACDDAAMLRYVIEQTGALSNQPLELGLHWASSQWSLLRDRQSIFSGGVYQGISDIGRHALGGILQHSAALSCIYWLSEAGRSEHSPSSIPFSHESELQSPDAFCKPSFDATSPRESVLELHAVPASGNYYLSCAATIMAMIDGIQNKTPLPSREQVDAGSVIPVVQNRWDRQKAAEALDADSDFLTQGDVFSEDLIDWIRGRVQSPS